MRLLIIITFILCQVILQSPLVGSAEKPVENKTVAESINGIDPIVEKPDEFVEPVEDPNVIVQKSPFLMIAQLIAALVFVIFLIYFLFRFVNKRSQSYQSTQLLQNIGGVQLGANRSVQLVKVGDRLLIVGVGETIQLLKEIDQKEEIERMLAQQEEQFQRFDQPLNKLAKLLNIPGKSKKAASIDEENSNKAAFKHILTNQIKEVKESQQKLHDAVRERDK